MDAPVQLGLLTSAEMPAEVFERLESRGVYTGARLRQQRPELYEQVLALLREGVTPLGIEEALHVEHRTVEAVAAAHSIPIPTAKRRMAERFRFAADRALDMVARATEAKDAKDYMITAGIANQHWQLLAGEATARVESTEIHVDAKDWNGWIDSAVGNGGAKGPGTAGNAPGDQANGPVIDLAAVPAGPATDSESGGSGCGGGLEARKAGSCIPEAAENEGQPGQKGGRGGLAPISTGGDGVDDLGNGNFSTKGPDSPAAPASGADPEVAP